MWRAVRSVGRRDGLRTTDRRGTGLTSGFVDIACAGAVVRDRVGASGVLWLGRAATLRAALVTAEAFERIVDIKERKRPGGFGDADVAAGLALVEEEAAGTAADLATRWGDDATDGVLRFSIEEEARGATCVRLTRLAAAAFRAMFPFTPSSHKTH